jgi:RNA polymerase sigma factor (TIGR02999 family)
MSRSADVTRLLEDWTRGDQDALAELMPAVYDELHRRAQAYLRRERPDHTLQPTALIHEAFLRLVDQRSVRWQSRVHFYAIAAQQMRRILVDHARARHAAKRGQGLQRVSLDEAAGLPEQSEAELIALDEALQRLAEVDPRTARVVELRFFGGLTVEETAEALGISDRTVKRAAGRGLSAAAGGGLERAPGLRRLSPRAARRRGRGRSPGTSQSWPASGRPRSARP